MFNCAFELKYLSHLTVLLHLYTPQNAGILALEPTTFKEKLERLKSAGVLEYLQ